MNKRTKITIATSVIIGSLALSQAAYAAGFSHTFLTNEVGPWSTSSVTKSSSYTNGSASISVVDPDVYLMIRTYSDSTGTYGTAVTMLHQGSTVSSLSSPFPAGVPVKLQVTLSAPMPGSVLVSGSWSPNP